MSCAPPKDIIEVEQGRGVPTGWKPVLPGPVGLYPAPATLSPLEKNYSLCGAQGIIG